MSASGGSRKYPAAHRGLMDAMLFARLEEKLQKQKKELQAGSTEFQEIEKGINSLTHKIKGECVDLVQGISGLHNQIMSLTEENKKYKVEISSLLSILASKDAEIEDLSSKIKTLLSSSEGQEELSKASIAQIQNLQTKLHEQTCLSDSLSKDMDVFKLKLNDLNQTYENMKISEVKYLGTIKELEEINMKLETEIRSLKLQNLDNDRIVGGLEEKCKKFEDLFDSLSKKHSLASTELEIVTKQKYSLSEEIDGLKSRIHELTIKFETDLRFEIDAHSSTRMQLKLKTDEMDGILSAFRKSREDYDLLLRNYEDLRRFSETKSNNEEDRLRVELDKMKTLCESEASKREAIGREFSEAKKDWNQRNNTTEQIIQSLSTQNQENQRRCFALETQLATLQNELGMMRNNRDAQVTEIRKLQTEKSDMLSRLSKIQPMEENIEKQRREIRNVFEKIQNAEEATEASLTCLSCMQYLEDSMTLVPCGHTFCSKCVGRDVSSCPECHTMTTPAPAFRNMIVDQVAGKYVYKRQTLDSLRSMIFGK